MNKREDFKVKCQDRFINQRLDEPSNENIDGYLREIETCILGLKKEQEKADYTIRTLRRIIDVQQVQIKYLKQQIKMKGEGK